jgi:hypothetical protein
MGMSIGLYTLNFDMARFKQNKGITEKMINAFMTVNDIEGMKIKQELEDRKNGIFNTKSPLINPSNNPELNTHLVNSWLFTGIKQR